ncbi:MAG: cobyric acid synthase [Thermoflavifilum sp.]|nr:cobyric acid synthase [Thermoflavifilum sp.]MCL6514119.1 cobyric acid synthase [Alicyclobacillus sp.]
MPRNLMLVGTASNVGKSVLCTAFCRILYQDGLRVAPFKAQNMALNSAATPSGREIGRAQAVQAEACGLLPNEHMNPVLLKPTGAMQTQVVLQGRVWDTVPASAYFRDGKNVLWRAVVESYEYLRDRYDLLVIEGAGSPVEMNLKPRDIANMRTAELADAVVLLVADIDRGGVFASVVGTLQLLEPHERARVAGVIVNKFRGDPTLFSDGVDLLQSYTGVPVLGIIPYLPDVGIDEEDSVGLEGERYAARSLGPEALRIGIVRLPHIANFTDVDPLFLEPDVAPAFLERPPESVDAEGSGEMDALILPGTKSTMGDLGWLWETGWAHWIQRAAARGLPILGICGGYQMLGQSVVDPNLHEADVTARRGLGLGPHRTTIGADKQTVPVEGELLGPFVGLAVSGYEIHMGRTEVPTGVPRLARVRTLAAAGVGPSAREALRPEGPWREDGIVLSEGRVVGTYLHGILHNDAFRAAWLNALRRRRGLHERPPAVQVREARRAALDRLADHVRAHVDMKRIYQLLEVELRGPGAGRCPP